VEKIFRKEVKSVAIDESEINFIKEKRERMLAEIKKIIVGQDRVIELLLLSLLSRGHSIFIGVPGLAKTLLVNTLSDVLRLKFSRIQFTPDLMPSDIVGSEVLDEEKLTGKRSFRFIKGPIFANIVLADEINRTPPKTQSALLQAMQEYQVTAGGVTYSLEEPFIVFATQNPIEHEGTYPLPEAQLDRFMFMINVDYPDGQEEFEIVEKTTSLLLSKPQGVLSSGEILKLQELVRGVPVAESVIKYAIGIVRKTRPKDPSSLEFVRKWVEWGAGPRASQFLILGAKAKALLNGRLSPSTDDVRSIAVNVLSHRIELNFRASAEGIRSEDVVQEILKE